MAGRAGQSDSARHGPEKTGVTEGEKFVGAKQKIFPPAGIIFLVSLSGPSAGSGRKNPRTEIFFPQFGQR